MCCGDKWLGHILLARSGDSARSLENNDGCSICKWTNLTVKWEGAHCWVPSRRGTHCYLAGFPDRFLPGGWQVGFRKNWSLVLSSFYKAKCNTRNKKKSVLTGWEEQNTSLSGLKEDERRYIWEKKSWHIASLQSKNVFSNKESFQLAKSLISTERLIRI